MIESAVVVLIGRQIESMPMAPQRLCLRVLAGKGWRVEAFLIRLVRGAVFVLVHEPLVVAHEGEADGFGEGEGVGNER